MSEERIAALEIRLKKICLAGQRIVDVANRTTTPDPMIPVHIDLIVELHKRIHAEEWHESRKQPPRREVER